MSLPQPAFNENSVSGTGPVSLSGTEQKQKKKEEEEGRTRVSSPLTNPTVLHRAVCNNRHSA